MPRSFSRALRTLVALSAASVLALSCGGGDSPTGPPDDDDPVVAPEVSSLELRLARVDQPWVLRDTIAHLEAVEVRWETENSPTSCSKTHDWSGSITKVWGGVDTTRALPGSRTYTIGVECSNSAGSDEKTVTVVVAAPGERMAISDRPDPTDEPTIKVLYILPSDAEVGNLVSDGWLQKDVDAMQNFLADQMGRMFRMDVFNGGDLDIATIRLNQTADELASVGWQEMHGIVGDRIRTLEFSQNSTKYLAYYNGPCQCSNAGGGNLALVYADPDDPPAEEFGVKVTALHELFHTFRIVDPNAPNYSKNDHTDGPWEDIMAGHHVARYSYGAELDPGHDDYYCPETGDCGENIADLHDEEADQYFTDPGSSYTGTSGNE